MRSAKIRLAVDDVHARLRKGERWVRTECGLTHAASFEMGALSSARIRLVIATETAVVHQSGRKSHDGGDARNLGPTRSTGVCRRFRVAVVLSGFKVGSGSGQLPVSLPVPD